MMASVAAGYAKSISASRREPKSSAAESRAVFHPGCVVQCGTGDRHAEANRRPISPPGIAPACYRKPRREFLPSFAFHPPRLFPHPISPWTASSLRGYLLSVFGWRTHPVPIMMHVTAAGDMRHGAVSPQEM
jgi:hypothetical protein